MLCTGVHRSRFQTCGFVPMSYFYSETDNWSKDGAKRWARLWSATASRQFHRNFHFVWNRKCLVAVVAARNLQSIKTLLTLEVSQYLERGSTFFSSESVAARSDCRRLGNALCLCSPVRPAQAVPERGPNLAPKRSAFDFAVKTFDCPLE